MRLLTLRYGDRQLSSGSAGSSRMPFSFPAPVDGVYALLRSFYLSRDESDMPVNEVRVTVQALFDPLQSRTDGEVQVDFAFIGPGDSWPVISPEYFHTEIGILVVGI